MTHKIKVQMFGNFRMDYNGAPFVAEKMHKESQFNRMMQALIHYSDCGIAKDKLEEIVIGERDIDAPHTALRVIVYKTKQKLAQLGLPGKNLIYLEGGIYYWTPDIEIEEDAAEFEKCDRLYSYLENNKSKFGRKEAFIITESDQLEYIEQLINDFPEITFHIAASTIMSDKLTRLDINNNVELYPCITEQKRKELFERCDIYLDINHYRELYNAVNEAMVNNMIILAFDNTAHSKELYPMGNIFESSNYVKMKETLKNIITSQTIFNEYIDRQKKQLKQLAAKVVMGDTDESI